MKKTINFILSLILILSLFYNVFYGAAYINTAPETIAGLKITPSLSFVIEPIGKTRNEKDSYLFTQFKKFSTHTENDFLTIKYEYIFARLWIFIIVYFALKFSSLKPKFLTSRD